MHSRQLQYTAKNFTAQQEALLHNRKFCCIAEKSILRQKLEKSSFYNRNRGKAPHSVCHKHVPGRRGIVCAQAGPI